MNSARRLAIVGGNHEESHVLMANNRKLQTDIVKVYNQNPIYIYCVTKERVHSGKLEIGRRYHKLISLVIHSKYCSVMSHADLGYKRDILNVFIMAPLLTNHIVLDKWHHLHKLVCW
jgi:hypothetical protein